MHIRRFGDEAWIKIGDTVTLLAENLVLPEYLQGWGGGQIIQKFSKLFPPSEFEFGKKRKTEDNRNEEKKSGGQRNGERRSSLSLMKKIDEVLSKS